MTEGSMERHSKGIVPLTDHPVSHAGRKPIMHPELGRKIFSQTAVRYLLASRGW